MRVLMTVCFAMVGFAVAPALASPSAAVIEDASVERGTDGRTIVRWRAVPADAPIDVTIDGRVISEDDRDGGHELSATDAARRPLIVLTTASGRRLTTAERLLPLEGGRNFRDLGGYLTSDGRRVKWGSLYRSGTMAHLTDRDYELLSRLGIRVVCDFRANEEREHEPTVWPTVWKARGAKLDYRVRDYRTESNLAAVFGEGTPTAEAVRAAMTRLYGDLAYDHADSYRTMFKSLAAGEIPLAFNCKAGKDRAGKDAALVLPVLGVPRDTVVTDYALSEKVVNYEAQYASEARGTSADKKGPYDFVAKLPADVRAPLMRSDPAYIRAGLAAIERKEGSVDAYFERVLGLSPAERARIRERLLEPST